MTQQTINIGAAANDHTGDTLRAAGGKINANFTELYTGGADPLFLLQGMSVTANDPTLGGNPNDRYAFKVALNTTTVNSDPSFSNTCAGSFRLTIPHGQNNYNATTLAKESFFALSLSTDAVGSGQRFVFSNNIVGYGMGDVALHGNDYVQFAGGPTDGDEGQGWGLASSLTQQTFLSTTTVSSVPTRSAANTTTTQIINKSMTAQTVTVASTTGLAAGHWVVVDQELPTSGSNMESVKIISVVTSGTPGAVSAIFRCNHANGATITPALLLVLASHSTIGQDRVLVNWTQPNYATGTIASITGGGFAGAGTTWTVGMVGGWAKNIGAITLPADDYHGAPFSVPSPLKSVYQIKSLVSTTSLGILSTTVAGDASYRGFGPGPTGRGAANQAYKIVPCAKILRIAEGMLICETSTSTWTVGDSVEQVFCPYPDVTGFQYSMASFSPGGMQRAFMHVSNSGARKFGSFIALEDWSTIHEPGADGTQWGGILDLSCSCDYIIKASQCPVALGAFLLPSAASGQTDVGGTIRWDTQYIRPNTANTGMDFQVTDTVLAFSKRSTPRNPDPNFSEMLWPGIIHTPFPGGGARPYWQFDRETTTVTDYTRLRMGYDNAAFPPGFQIYTEQGGTGVASDIVLKTNGVEQLRAVSGSTVQFSNPASFSANGSVATSITSVGPTGAATTVQKWLTIKDNSGVTRYIPCF